MQRKLVFFFVLFIAGFAAGFIPQYSRSGRLQQEFSASTRQLESCRSGEQLSQLRDAASLMYLEATQKNYGTAGGTLSSFLTKPNELRIGRVIQQYEAYSVRFCQHAIGSPAIWRRAIPPWLGKSSQCYPR